MSTAIPSDLKYTQDHEWVRLEGKICIIGITAFAAEQLGDVVAVELPEEGDDFSKGDAIGAVESVKTVADLYSPVSGTVVAVNSPLNDSPEYVNEDPYDEGWMVHIEMTNPDELDDLLDMDGYAGLVNAEE